MITGLYLPTDGTIKIGGKGTKDISGNAIYKGISAVFQNYQKYKLTLHDNINISNTQKSIGIKASIQKAGLAIDKINFPQGIETMLSREFNGIDLSGGQWQRIAIARGFFKAHDLDYS